MVETETVFSPHPTLSATPSFVDHSAETTFSSEDSEICGNTSFLLVNPTQGVERGV
jgi:hypothetical protein